MIYNTLFLPSHDVTKQPNAESLAQFLRDAESAHADFERELGKRDSNWSLWYAQWLIGHGRIR